MNTPYELASGKRNAVALKREFKLAKQRGQIRTVTTNREAQIVAEYQAKAKKRLEQIRQSL
jgi:hypothetical protein